MSKTSRLAEFFQNSVSANYIARTLHGNQHGPPRYLFHGGTPHTLKAWNHGGTQHGPQSNDSQIHGAQPKAMIVHEKKARGANQNGGTAKVKSTGQP